MRMAIFIYYYNSNYLIILLQYFFVGEQTQLFRVMHNIITICSLFYPTFGTLTALLFLHYLLKYLELVYNAFHFTLQKAKNTENKRIRRFILTTACKQHVYMLEYEIILL